MPEQPGRELYDDIAWYEGRYPSQKDVSDRARRGRGSGVARLDPRRAAAAASETGEVVGTAVTLHAAGLAAAGACMSMCA